MTRPETLTDIQRAARFFYLQHYAFAGKVTGADVWRRDDRPLRRKLVLA